MDWKRACEEERAALKRIVALLFALAGLAELACHRSPAVLGFVLWLLRHAEAVAWDFVGDVPGMPPMQIGQSGDRPVDAMRLAARFRALARELDRQARLAFRGEGRNDAGPQPSGRMPAMRRTCRLRGCRSVRPEARERRQCVLPQAFGRWPGCSIDRQGCRSTAQTAREPIQ